MANSQMAPESIPGLPPADRTMDGHPPLAVLGDHACGLWLGYTLQQACPAEDPSEPAADGTRTGGPSFQSWRTELERTTSTR
jgi:hypothetical protein